MNASAAMLHHGRRPTAAPRPDGSDVLEDLLLPPTRRRALESLCRGLSLRPGDVRECVRLAIAAARQCLVPPIATGTHMRRRDGRGSEQVVVGTKPAGFLEDWQLGADARRRLERRNLDGGRRWEDHEALVWTVDPTSSRPGISQSRLSDWEMVDASGHRV